MSKGAISKCLVFPSIEREDCTAMDAPPSPPSPHRPHTTGYRGGCGGGGCWHRPPRVRLVRRPEGSQLGAGRLGRLEKKYYQKALHGHHGKVHQYLRVSGARENAAATPQAGAGLVVSSRIDRKGNLSAAVCSV